MADIGAFRTEELASAKSAEIKALEEQIVAKTQDRHGRVVTEP